MLPKAFCAQPVGDSLCGYPEGHSYDHTPAPHACLAHGLVFNNPVEVFDHLQDQHPGMVLITSTET